MIKTGLRRLPGFYTARLVLRLFAGGQQRSYVLLQLRRPAGLFQPYGTTRIDRYSDIFDFVSERIGDGPDRRILSFGCATGEEVFTLRHWYPQAVIKGIDLNPRSIAVCHQKLPPADAPRTAFAVAGSTAAEPADSYDAIFAMAVFRHGDLSGGPPRCDHRIRFDQVEQAVSEIARCLKPGGYLIIRYAQFDFLDTAIAREFHPVLFLPLKKGAPKYGRDNKIKPPAEHEAVVFCKSRAP